jgi:hypothetical protein
MFSISPIRTHTAVHLDTSSDTSPIPIISNMSSYFYSKCVQLLLHYLNALAHSMLLYLLHVPLKYPFINDMLPNQLKWKSRTFRISTLTHSLHPSYKASFSSIAIFIL